MKKRFCAFALFALVPAVLISACGNNTVSGASDTPPTAVPSITNTPDPCTPENIELEVQKVHKLMREFDDGSSLAASLPANQLSDAISNLQRIRRDAEDQVTPSCLIPLKTLQISHMNTMISTLINLIGYANGTVDKQVIDQGIALARQEHDNYTIELARVLGLTMVPASNIAPPTPTPSP